MNAVLTLIAAPDTDFDQSQVEAVRDALSELGIDSSAPAWLSLRRACDISFCGSPDQADAAARRVLGNAPIDVVAQHQLDRRKRLLLADMESTIIRQEMLDELGILAGHGESVADITRSAMNGEIPFDQAMIDRVALLAGLPVTALESACDRITLTPGALVLVRTMRKFGAWCVLVSGGIRVFSDRVATMVGFDARSGNNLEIVGGKLTGRLVMPILGPDSKADLLVRTVVARRIPIRATLAVGDGANDLPMLGIAGLGVAFHARPAVVAATRVRINYADLTGLLYAQGYGRNDFVT